MEAALQGPTGRIVLGPTVLTIGRITDNQLVVNDAKASSHHAEIRLSPNGQGYIITDNGSTNGTFVNEQRLDRNIPRWLNHNDRIRIGDTIFNYEVSSPSQIAPTYITPSQPSSPSYAPTVPAASEFTGYGGGAQEAYPPYTPPTPPQQPYAPPAQPSYTPQQQPYTPQPYAAPAQPYLPPTEAAYPPSSPSYPPYSPPPPQPAYMPPAAPNYGTPAAPQPYAQQAYGPPAYTAPAPVPTQRKSGGGLRIAIIALVIIIILGAGGGGAYYYFATRPQPMITITSAYSVGTTPAGATTTVLHVSGQKFSANSAISFLLDGTSAPGSSTVQSDANGNVKADLTITAAWTVGNHTITAKDASNYITKSGVAITIVTPGQANTPGPNGAPPDAMSFSLSISIQRKDSTNNQQLSTLNETLVIKGAPDPAGGTVCRSFDNNQPQTFDGKTTDPSITYHETYTLSCSGTYKGGKLSYTESATSDKYAFSTGVSCTANTPYTVEQLDGTFSSQNSISGTYSSAATVINCSNGQTLTFFDPEKGTWTGQM